MYSEDPKLSSDLAVAFITGMQGTNYNATPATTNYTLIGGCAKHYAAYDVENRPISRVQFNAIVSNLSANFCIPRALHPYPQDQHPQHVGAHVTSL